MTNAQTMHNYQTPIFLGIGIWDLIDHCALVINVKCHPMLKQLSEYQHRFKDLKIDKAALLVIDMQRYFCDEDSHAYVTESPRVIDNTQKVLEYFRGNDRPVFFTSFSVKEGEYDPIANWWEDTVKEGSSQAEITKDLSLREDEIIIRKPTYDAFIRTDLEKMLHERGIKQLVITGVLTNFCCETSARSAFCRGFDVFVISDAVAAFDDEAHLASLKNLAWGFASVVEVGDILVS